MNWRPVAVACLTSVLVFACGSPPSTSPTMPSPQFSGTVSQTPLRTVSARLARADLAACVGSGGDLACFSAAIVEPEAAAATAPGAPSNLVSTVSGTTVMLSWTAPSSGDPVTGYVVEAGSAAGLADLASLATGSTTTTLSVPGVPSGTYYVRVRGRNGGGTGGASNEVQFIVGSTARCDSIPDPPTDMTSSLDGNVLTLSWRAPAAGCVESYVIEAGTTEAGTDLADFDTGSTSTTFTTDLGSAGSVREGFVAAPLDGPIHTRTKAKNGRGKSRASNTTSVTRTSTTTIDVQPRTVANLGTISGCAGGSLSAPFQVTAPGASWTVGGVGAWAVTPMVGSGSRTITLRIDVRPSSPTPGTGTTRCRDGNRVVDGGGFFVSFTGGVVRTVRVTFYILQPLWT